MKNNWDSLHKNALYYRLIFDSELIVQRIVFDAIYDTIAVFQPVNKPKMNINLLKDFSEEDYEVGVDALPRLKSFIDSDILLNRLKEQYSIIELASNSDTSSLPTAGYIFSFRYACSQR